MRMPISAVRCWTEYAINPYTPIAAKQQRATTKDGHEPHVKVGSRGRFRDDLVHGPNPGDGSPLASRSTFSIDAAADNGGVVVRAIHTIGNSLTFRAVTPSGSCAIGTYIAGLAGRVRPVSRTFPTMPTTWRRGS